jgi:hypothetical protein
VYKRQIYHYSQESEDSNWEYNKRMKNYWIINPKLRDYKPKKIAPAIIATHYKEPPLVLVTPRSTNTQSRSTKNILTTKTMETSQKLKQKNYPTLTSYVEVSLVKRSLLQESEEDLKILEELCSLISPESCVKSNPLYYCLRMSKAYSLTKKGTLSKPSSERLMNWGMTVNGKCLTAKISESHKTESECSLSDILEEQVDPKYFLLEEQTKKILNQL